MWQIGLFAEEIACGGKPMPEWNAMYGDAPVFVD
jgi:hypothetical protein